MHYFVTLQVYPKTSREYPIAINNNKNGLNQLVPLLKMNNVNLC